MRSPSALLPAVVTVALANVRLSGFIHARSSRPRNRAELWDRAAAVAAGIVAGALSFVAIATLDRRFFDPAIGSDVWFEGDLPRIANEMTHRWAAHSRAPVHPLFSLISCVVVYALEACGLKPLTAVAVLTALGAGVWAALLFVLLRSLTPSRTDAALFTAVGCLSAAALFWATVPETYVFGSATILAALVIAAAAERRPVGEGPFVAASALTLSITVTNWMAGLLTSWVYWPWRRALQITATALAVVVVLWSVQRLIVPHADFFVGYSNEQRYLLRPEAGGPPRVLAVLLVDAIVMPPLHGVEKAGRGVVMSVQRAAPLSGGPLRRFTVAVWAVLFGIGLYGWMRAAPHSRTLAAVGLILTGQVVLYVLYGTETFLYALNVAPLLLVIASCSTRTRARQVAMGLALLLLVLAALNNGDQWMAARRWFDR